MLRSDALETKAKICAARASAWVGWYGACFCCFGLCCPGSGDSGCCCCVALVGVDGDVSGVGVDVDEDSSRGEREAAALF